MGTPAFAVPTLTALIESPEHEVVAVCTQPDRPAGRGHKLQASPVKMKAQEHGIPVLQPETFKLEKSQEIREQLKAFDADIFVVVAYGLLLPKGILKIPPFGCINAHASLLPKYRGASPIQAALLNGDRKTGITMIYMDTGLDTGDMILKKTLPLSEEDCFTTVHDKLAHLSGEATLFALSQLWIDFRGRVRSVRFPQGTGRESYAPLITKADGHINWQDPMKKIINQCRALNPWPGCYTTYMGMPLKIWAVKARTRYSKRFTPGTIIRIDPAIGILVQTGNGTAWITELQAQGAKRMPATDYLRGRDMIVGEVLV